LSPRKPAPRIASRVHASGSAGFLAVWRRLNDGQRFHFQTLLSLFSRASQHDGCNAESDAPPPLHFIGAGRRTYFASCPRLLVGDTTPTDQGMVRTIFLALCQCCRLSPAARAVRERARSFAHAQPAGGGAPALMVGTDEDGGRRSPSRTRSRPLVDADRIKAARIGDPLGVGLTERACRPLIRLSTRRTAAARAARVSGPRPTTLLFCPQSRCHPVPTPATRGARVTAHAQRRRWRGHPAGWLVLDEGAGGRRLSRTRSRPPVVGRWWTPTGSRRHASVTR
ncbi:hypothetical protein EVAR_60633_1, partial [Eumeta japonica]